MLSFWHCTFAMPKHIDVIDIALFLCWNIYMSLTWLADNSGKMVIYAFLLFLLGFSSHSR